jgi:hypothetical protein
VTVVELRDQKAEPFLSGLAPIIASRQSIRFQQWPDPFSEFPIIS